jgi:type III secretion system (T3SS) SseB-like protein
VTARTDGEDVGDPDPALVAALASGDLPAIRRELLRARVLVPIVAMGEESTGAEMAVPRLVGVDGRDALPVFTSYDALRAWRADPRPVPMSGEQAIAAAMGEGYDAVVVDIAGPITHVVDLERSDPLRGSAS